MGGLLCSNHSFVIPQSFMTMLDFFLSPMIQYSTLNQAKASSCINDILQKVLLAPSFLDELIKSLLRSFPLHCLDLIKETSLLHNRKKLFFIYSTDIKGRINVFESIKEKKLRIFWRKCFEQPCACARFSTKLTIVFVP